ncbi:hypothetical protein MACH21_21060 [Roseicyclus marinus]|uniref:Uncharacterized protein n=1 Tax=Roseicyclus marinus TaxID=2161673 RepID=A0AA48HHY0_9RHOB|nr:hypothetical protein MACH21_21060 [Roseicyclus marinus]
MHCPSWLRAAFGRRVVALVPPVCCGMPVLVKLCVIHAHKTSLTGRSIGWPVSKMRPPGGAIRMEFGSLDPCPVAPVTTDDAAQNAAVDLDGVARKLEA